MAETNSSGGTSDSESTRSGLRAVVGIAHRIARSTGAGQISLASLYAALAEWTKRPADPGQAAALKRVDALIASESESRQEVPAKGVGAGFLPMSSVAHHVALACAEVADRDFGAVLSEKLVTLSLAGRDKPVEALR